MNRIPYVELNFNGEYLRIYQRPWIEIKIFLASGTIKYEHLKMYMLLRLEMILVLSYTIMKVMLWNSFVMTNIWE